MKDLTLSDPLVLREAVRDWLRTARGDLASVDCPVQPTVAHYRGEVTVVLFPVVRVLKQAPQQVGEQLLVWLTERFPGVIEEGQVVGGFLNLRLSGVFWRQWLHTRLVHRVERGEYPLPWTLKDKPVLLVEFSSPNTNKPLHLGHVRNNTLGDAIARLLAMTGRGKVVRLNLINDRGIHICKTMLAWMKWGGGATPQSTGKKGDHFVGDFYVLFERRYKEEVERLVREKGMAEEEARREAPLIREAQELLRRWEAGDPEVRQVWKMMNEWVLEGFRETYRRYGVRFDAFEFESETYQRGKELVYEGLEKGVFFRKEDGSVWVDLTDEGLDTKLLLRGDGTSVYITQDLGTIDLRWQKYRMDRMIYVVAEEQRYHFQVLKAVLHRLGKPYADTVFHLSYAMVELPEGKMKSREGTVIDADDFLDELTELALEQIRQSEKAKDVSEEEKRVLAEQVALAAIKFYMLRVDPNKKILFRKEEAMDFEGYSGPFLQYTYARIQALLRKAWEEYGLERADIVRLLSGVASVEPTEEERRLLQMLYFYPVWLWESAERYDPSLLANALYQLAKEYNRYYARVPILRSSEEERVWRLALSLWVGETLAHGCGAVLNIPMPDRM